MPHRNARLTVHARLLIVERYRAGWPQARIGEQLGVSRATVKKWIDRYEADGLPGLEDRSSRPHSSPTRTSPVIEAQVLELRIERHRGAVFLAGELGLVASTVGRILRRHQVPSLASIDPITGEPIRRRRGGPRYERRRPGELLHVDVKKLGRVPDGGGWRLHGRDATVDHRHKKTPIGFDYLHVAVDDHSRLAYIEALPDEKDPTCAGSCTAPRAGSTSAVWVWSGCSPTTPGATAAVEPGPRSASGWASAVGSSSPAAPGRTEKPSGSTAPCSPSSPTPGPGPATPSGWPPSTAGWTTTTLAEPTPPSAASHPSPDSPANNVPGHDS